MVLLTLFYLLFPLVVIYLCQKVEWINKIGAVFVCYLAGAVLGNCGVLPDGAALFQDNLSGIFVAIALPLLLFSMNVKAWIKTAGKAILSLTGATIMIVAVAGAGCLIIAEKVPESWKIGGLAIGVYTGGTPNMAAIKTALDVDPTLYIMMHTYDVAVSFAYILFCITIAQKLLNRFLPAYERTHEGNGYSPVSEAEDIQSYKNMVNRSVLTGLAMALLLSSALIGTALGISSLFPKTVSTAVTILTITSLGIGVSFVKRIRQIKKTYQLGMYFILAFCLVVGSMANLAELIHIHWVLLFYICFCVFGTFILHAIFCKAFHIDTDTFIVTSVSAVCSPPFVPVVAQALNNRQIILSGLTTGIIGYAIGNYLGISFAYIFKAMTG